MRHSVTLALVLLGACTIEDNGGNPGTPDGGMPADAGPMPDGCVGAGCVMPGQCPSGMVWISPTTCIDKTEATVSDFLQFIDGLGSACTDPGPTCTACGGQRCFISNVDNPWHYDDGWYIDGSVGMSLQHPARYVTHAAAKSACAAKGKRLCRGDEWQRACSGPTGLAYPYGNAFQMGVCNTASGITGSPDAVGSNPNCAHQATPSLVDMSGNIWEWTSDCSGGECDLRGGSFYVDGSFFPMALSCAGTKGWEVIDNEVFGTEHDFGYRCCASPL